MGLLSLGTPLDWEKARLYADHVRQHGITQFLATYARNRDTGRLGDLYWGDEVEYMLIHFDPATKNATLSLRAFDLLTQLGKDEIVANQNGHKTDMLWRPEYARYMLEATPGVPYGLKLGELMEIHPNMKRRRQAASVLLEGDHEFLACITNFPRLGDSSPVPFMTPHVDPAANTQVSESKYIPDDAINPHPRFRTLTNNIRQRRGPKKVAMNIPLYKDVDTPWPFVDPDLSAEYAKGAALKNHIYMDCMCFGMGCSCLQVTLQASQMCEARRLYDQLAVLSPIMLALTASAPFFRGYLADVDCRWNVIAGSVDDRTNMEQQKCPAQPQSHFQFDQQSGSIVQKPDRTPLSIPKSRYDSVSTYISQHASFQTVYNDLEIPIDNDIHYTLVNSGVDAQLARHVAHLFVRDPLVIYLELLDQDDQVSIDHFENIQSTNWQTMRFKPPPTMQPELGWRVEFRSMEVQVTDYENAAYSVFLVLVSRIILCLELDLYIPISKVDVNMQAAQARDAVLDGTFWFRANSVPDLKSAIKILEAKLVRVDEEKEETGSLYSTPLISPTDFTSTVVSGATKASCTSFGTRSRTSSVSPPTSVSAYSGHHKGSPKWVQMSMDTIMNGGREFPGLVPLVRVYIGMLEMNETVRTTINQYLQLMSDRGAGKVATWANYLRQCVHKHPMYQHDSRISPEINYDLMREVQKWTDLDTYPDVPPVIY